MSLKFNLLIVLLFLICLGCHSDKKYKIQSNNKNLDSLLFIANDDKENFDTKLIANQNAENLVFSNSIPDSLKINYAFKLANRYYNLNEYKHYQKVTQKIIAIALKEQDSISISKAYSYLGDYYYRVSIIDSALINYIQADKIYKRIDTGISNRIENLISMARVKSVAHDFTGAEILVTEALVLLRNTSDYQNMYEAYTILGYLSNEVRNYNQALDAHFKALNIVRKNDINNSHNQAAASLNNIGNVYQNLNEHDKALGFFNEGLAEQNVKINRPDIYALLVDNISYSKFKLKMKDRVLEGFQEALHIRDSLKLDSSVLLSQIRISEYYQFQKDTFKAIEYAKMAWTNAQITTRNIDKLMVLRQLLAIDRTNASENSEKYINITDSLQQAERKVKDKFARIQFETQEISQENDKLNAQNRNLVLIFCGILMIGLLLFVIRTQRAKNRELMLKQGQQKANEDIYNLMISQQNKIEEGRIREKKRIAQEIHDGVLGRLFGARLNLDSLNRVVEGEVRERTTNYLNELKNIEQDLREISHDLNREKTVLINNFVAILNNLFEEQAKNFPSEVSVNIDNHIVWEEISNNLKINIYRIFQEGLQNINKYAQASLIKVALHLEGEFLILEIQDDGIGFAVDRKKSGIGLQNMQSRTQECDGKFKIESQKGQGTKISIKFPISEEVSEEFAVNTDPVLA